MRGIIDGTGFFEVRWKNVLFSCLLTLGFLVFATALNLWFVHLRFHESILITIYLLCVLFVTSLTDGFLYGAFTGAIGILSFNFFFTEPRYSISIHDSYYIITFIVMIITATFTSILTSKIKRGAKEISMRERQALMERYRATLLRAISHDLRTPLVGIIGNTELLIQSCSDDAVGQRLNEIKNDAEWLHSLVENILNLTRLIDGRLAVKKELQSVEEVVEVAVRRVGKLRPSMRIEVDIGEYISLYMDARLIEQLIINLLENAFKHGGGVAIVRVERRGGYVAIVVNDNGKGIAEADLPHIFEMFYSTGKNESKSSGLGLPICDAIVRAHGGEITVGNGANGGAEFVALLPIEVSE